MKSITLLLLLSLAFLSCKNEPKTAETAVTEDVSEIAYASFGASISNSSALSTEKMMEQYKNLKQGDTITTKMSGTIIDVCSKKGCWMTLDTGEDQNIMVKFKDYGFFMPLDARGDVVINGQAFITETSVDELRHYAEDAGKSEAEIAAITAPKLEYQFIADGVLLEQ